MVHHVDPPGEPRHAGQGHQFPKELTQSSRTVPCFTPPVTLRSRAGARDGLGVLLPGQAGTGSYSYGSAISLPRPLPGASVPDMTAQGRIPAGENAPVTASTDAGSSADESTENATAALSRSDGAPAGSADFGRGAVVSVASEGLESPEYFSDTPMKYRRSNLGAIDYRHSRWPVGSVIARRPPGSVTCQGPLDQCPARSHPPPLSVRGTALLTHDHSASAARMTGSGSR